VDRRTFSSWLFTAPILMKSSLTSFASPAAAHSIGERIESDDSLCYASVDQLKALFQSGKASPVDLLKAQMKRIGALTRRSIASPTNTSRKR
jgi:hypothetical protein